MKSSRVLIEELFLNNIRVAFAPFQGLFFSVSMYVSVMPVMAASFGEVLLGMWLLCFGKASSTKEVPKGRPEAPSPSRESHVVPDIPRQVAKSD